MMDRPKGLVRLQPMQNILALYGARAIEQNLGLPRLVFSPELAPVPAGPSSAARTAATAIDG